MSGVEIEIEIESLAAWNSSSNCVDLDTSGGQNDEDTYRNLSEHAVEFRKREPLCPKQLQQMLWLVAYGRDVASHLRRLLFMSCNGM